MPGLRYCVGEEADGNFFQLQGQRHLSLDGFADVDQGLSDCTCQSIKSEQLLGEHGVQGLLVLDWMLLRCLFGVEVWRDPAQKICGDLSDNIVLALSSATA